MDARGPVEVDAACHTCHGTGAEPGTSPVTCPRCGGAGTISESQGLFALSQPCPRCRGNGVIVEKPCPTCHGSGQERVTKRYAVKIPPGAKDGTRVRLKGKGEPGRNGGPPGDLFVVASVDSSPLYERRNADLVLDVALVSRVHCRLEANGETLEVIDLDSTNGIYVNGHRVSKRHLIPGDTLRVGRVELQVGRSA